MSSIFQKVFKIQKAYATGVANINSIKTVDHAKVMEKYIENFNRMFHIGEITVFGNETDNYVSLERLLQRKKISMLGT